jgi:biopolymer transport protein ExbB
MEGVLQLIEDGGPVLILLVGLSLFSLALIAWKVIALAGATAGDRRRDQALFDWSEDRREVAAAAVKDGNAPADRVVSYAMEALGQGIRGPVLEAELSRRGNEEVAAMGSWLRVLELIAMIAPLLGLLGTVLGMIQSFRSLAAAEGAANASVLAGGIWEALITTAAGLAVAIPASIGATLLAARVDAAGLRIESAVGRLMLIEGARGKGA